MKKGERIMTLKEKIKDIEEYYYETADFMCNNMEFFKKHSGTFEDFYKVLADTILHEFEKIRDDTKEEKKLVEIVETLKKVEIFKEQLEKAAIEHKSVRDYLKDK